MNTLPLFKTQTLMAIRGRYRWLEAVMAALLYEIVVLGNALDLSAMRGLLRGRHFLTIAPTAVDHQLKHTRKAHCVLGDIRTDEALDRCLIIRKSAPFLGPD
jgi:hypothetical protein